MLLKIPYKLVSCVLLKLFPNIIVSKEYDLSTTITYNWSQHLGFLFYRKVRYENEIKEVIKPLIKKDDLIFDIGANIGQYSLFFSKLVSGKTRVVSFEPDKRNFSFLVFNILFNSIKNVEYLNIGIGAVSGVTHFYTDSQTGGRKSSFIKEAVEENYEGVSYDVNVTSLDDISNNYGFPDFVKIDVEGFEVKVLNGLTSPNSKTIFLIEVRESSNEIVFNYFNNFNFKCYCIENRQMIDSFKTIPSFSNLLFFHYSKKPVAFN